MRNGYIDMNNEGREMSVEKVLKLFLNYSKAKNLSKRTISYYERRFSRFIEFLEIHEIKKIGQVNNQVVTGFILYLQNRIDNPISINTVLRAVRAVLYYAMKLDYLDEFKIQMLKTPDKVKETYTDDELKILLEKPNLKNCDFVEYRTWVMINWLLSTGNRIRTARNVRIKDIDFNESVVLLRTVKNRKQQIIPLTKKMLNILTEYLQYRGGKPDDFLFSSVYQEKLSTNAVVKAMSRYNKSRGIDKTSSHLFRHTFAKLWIKNGGDIFRLQKILGHSSLDMVKNYVNMFSADLKDNFEGYNPINNFYSKKSRLDLSD
jgi:integrase/recombinase XerD